MHWRQTRHGILPLAQDHSIGILNGSQVNSRGDPVVKDGGRIETASRLVGGGRARQAKMTTAPAPTATRAPAEITAQANLDSMHRPRSDRPVSRSPPSSSREEKYL